MNAQTEPMATETTQAAPTPAAQAPTKAAPYLQNRELSWLTFNERVLDQGADETVPLLERLNFISIFWSNLQEFFMVRVGSLTDLSLVKKHIVDSKSGMTPSEQLDAIYARCRELYPIQERTYEEVRRLLGERGVRHLRPDELDDEQRAFLSTYVHDNVMPFLSPQIINSRHPFPHLENGALYVVVRLNEDLGPKKKDAKPAKADKDAKAEKADKPDKAAVKEAKKAKNLGAEGVTLGLVPMPRQCDRVIELPGTGFPFILLEHAIEMVAAEIFSMYAVKHTNVVCVTRNADLDATEGSDEADEDYREHMKRILKKRSRLAPVRLESERPLSATLEKLLLARLSLKPHQMYATAVPLDLSFTFGLASRLPEKDRAALTNPPFSPQWPACLDRNRSVIEQVTERETLLSYPYESMDPFVQLLREAANDPSVISIKITLYRLASQSHLAEALIAAAENGKEVTALFELRARFDESNNIEWSQRFEQAGCKVIYGFRDFKVHSKICCITRQTEHGLQHITQLGTGNYNEKTAKLYTDLSFITTDATFGRDAVEFFRNMGLENTSDNYDIMWVAPLQIKPMILAGIDTQIAHARAGEPCGLFFKTNSVTDKDVIEKIVEASQAGVPVTLFVRGISCIVPGLPGWTENVRVVSIVGRLLEHSRIYGFGPRDSMKLYLSSADLMTRNMDKRIEIAWPVLNDDLREQILGYLDVSLSDTAKLRELLPDKSYTPLGMFAEKDDAGDTILFDSQEFFIRRAQERRLVAAEEEAARSANRRREEQLLATNEMDASERAAQEIRAQAAVAVAAAKASETAAQMAVATAEAAVPSAVAVPTTTAAAPQGASVEGTQPAPTSTPSRPSAPMRPQPTTTLARATVATRPQPHKPSLLVRVLSKFVR
ncbi:MULTISPECIES: polyphosphate kinase 1 [Gordonibacter]|uniref:Polyphosphate kinase n=1 Tax=Gordonibacter faecis TaxID=3047475 RepID=A0ABT7DQS8_9ACTN|nr:MULTISPECIES: polyphosphate kinase 1 [unclassified Gordonibacter]MDJ1650510.1 polyphosphate kinase 1 [Gordonibacter sp. KGMB12511]